MEITIDNAFLITAKLSLGPFIRSIDVISHKIQKTLLLLLIRVLEKPLLSVLIFTPLLLTVLATLTMSLLIIGAVFCMLLTIIIFEGFIFSVVLILSMACTLMFMGVVIILQGLKLLCLKADYD